VSDLIELKKSHSPFYLVLEQLPKEGMQVVLLSATIPADLFRDMTRLRNIMNDDFIKILVKKEQLTLEGIQQFFIAMENEDWKLDALCDLYTTDNFTHPTVIFCNTRDTVDGLLAKLEERGFAASATVRNTYLTANFTIKLIHYPLCSMAKNTRRIVNPVSRILGSARLGF